MENNLLNFDILNEEEIKNFIKANLCSALSKMIMIFNYCGYDIERYINNYYNSLNRLDYSWSITSLFFIIDDNGNKIDEKRLENMKEKHADEFRKIMKFFQKNGLMIDNISDDNYDNYFDCYLDFNKIINNGAVKTLLVSALRMYFIDGKTMNPLKYENSDYTYLMVNYVKSLERFMFYKLNKIEKINDYEKKHATFYNLEEKIKKYISENVKEIPDGLLEQYLNLLSKFREIYRNGYFHRDICSRKKATLTNELATILIIMTELIINV